MAVVGLKRSIAKWCERIACCLAHRVIVISKSLKNEAIREKLLSEDKAEVLGSGSSKGVNLEQFSLTPQIQSNAERIRHELNISKEGIAIGYAGRLTEEKGVQELVVGGEQFRDARHLGEAEAAPVHYRGPGWGRRGECAVRR